MQGIFFYQRINGHFMRNAKGLELVLVFLLENSNNWGALIKETLFHLVVQILVTNHLLELKVLEMFYVVK
jgi:hypothetical protein